MDTLSTRRAFAYRLIVALVCLRVVFFFGNVSAAAAELPAGVVLAQQSQAFEASDFLSYTNADRVAAGIAPLALSPELSAAALAKAEDMVSKGYWAHFRPTDNKAPWDFIDESGYRYKVAGENLAKGYRTPAGITEAWMHSPAHRANLMSPKYSDVGYASLYGVIDGERVLITVQMFGSR